MESDSSEKKSETQKKELPPGLQKICLVCGDKALGYNFNAISCESCKAFFRRNALASKEFKCPFTNNCEITVVTRRFCQKCRLEKCFAVGMVKEFIMSDQDKAEKRRKIEENRAKKRGHSDSDESVSSSKNMKHDEDLNCSSTNYQHIQDPSIVQVQYDVLNSTSCSPNSTVQSPMSHEIDLQSPPAYSHYPPVHTTDSYLHKVYPIDVKTVINRDLYEHRTANVYEGYTMLDGVDRPLMEMPKLNSNRSIVTNSKSMCHEQGRPDLCDQLPSTSSDPDASRARDILQDVERTMCHYQEDRSEHVCEQMPSTSSHDADASEARDILQDVERIEPILMESILCEAIKLEFMSYGAVKNCGGASRELNEVECAKLHELIVANKALNDPIDDDVSQLIGDTTNFGKSPGHDQRLIEIVNLTAVAIRRFIKMAKKISAFKNMCDADQEALFKGGCIEMMILRSTMTYDRQQDIWKIPSNNNKEFGSIGAEVLKLAKGDIYSLHRGFVRTFDSRLRLDENIILVMCAIVLFAPARANIVHKDVVQLEQNSYYYLLRRYLESVYPGCEAKSTFLLLLRKILELRKLAERVTGVYLDVNPIEPLLVEIFDLKQRGGGEGGA